MVLKAMVQQESCQGCHQKDDCQKMYKQLGRAEGPSIALKVCFAFLLPLVVFIASLAVFETVLTGSLGDGRLRTAAAFLLALLVTFICVLIVKFTNRHFGQDR